MTYITYKLMKENKWEQEELVHFILLFFIKKDVYIHFPCLYTFSSICHWIEQKSSYIEWYIPKLIQAKFRWKLGQMHQSNNFLKLVGHL